MAFYPKTIHERLMRPANASALADANAVGKSASFSCGSFAAISLSIEDDRICEARFRTNGCGFMLAVADVLCDSLRGKSVKDLHGLEAAGLMECVTAELLGFPAGRVQCAEIVFDALRYAMIDYRSRRIEEFQGEKALICTCFGVTEETIESAIAEHGLREVDEVSDLCRAGSGCGSCRMLIAEMLEPEVPRSAIG